ncbi:MobV family relaxase [Stenomitos frigidus]|uniref:Plasmid recombination enzyme n=1 Tax=Stenomitos frigidus ULC18 TaxID=2107698 RepID=A0A2T1EKG9_9CYAN|nr:MobV family relaxase [Stenomitos frigidus]PSB33246.1 hypothetical protein C7B82_04625 [Stenomitos frigidus ULC18]
MAYSILRFGKLKTASQITASQSHCTRTRETPNADPASTPLNRQLLGRAEGLWEQVESLLQVAASKRKTRPDANLACEVLLSASPEWFRQGHDRQRDLDPAQVERFATHATDFLNTAFGACCLSAVLHLDEITPHIHAHVVPLHPVKGWLSWEYWFGGREKLQAWQDQFAECMAPLGLQRGIKGTIATHEHIQVFYGRLQRDLAVPDLEREFRLPPPVERESVHAYHQRASAVLTQTAQQVQETLATLVAHAQNEAFAARQAKETRLTLHALSDQVAQLERDYVSAQVQVQTLSEQQKVAIAQELITTTNLVLNLAQSNYWKGRTYVFSRRRGFTKIDRRDGTRLVHDQGGTPTLTADFQPSDLAKISQARDTIFLAIAQQYEPQATQRSKRR